MTHPLNYIDGGITDSVMREAAIVKDAVYAFLDMQEWQVGPLIRAVAKAGGWNSALVSSVVYGEMGDGGPLTADLHFWIKRA